MSREENIRIFNDTEAFCRENKRLAAAIGDTIANTTLYRAGEVPEIPEGRFSDTEISVTKQRSFEAAKELREKYPESRIAVHNFASATNPGGGVTRGSSAQEESLCRCSTLYPTLNTKFLFEEYYSFHRKRNDARYTDAVIYTPDIVVFKNDFGRMERLPESEWISVDVITCAAPNLREKPSNPMNPDGGTTALKLSQSELLDIHKVRARKMLSCAAANGAEVVVLGAFGCGAFRNDPFVVSRAYKEVLPEFKGHFREIRFAVYCPPADSTNFNAFSRTLSR